MPGRSARWVTIVVLGALATAAGWFARRGTEARKPAREPRVLAALPLPAPAPELVAPAVAEPAPLAFAWPATGSVRVRAEHRREGESVREAFVLAWRTLEGGELFLESYPSAEAGEPPPPGPTRTSGTLLAPAQAVVSREGRFLGVPNEDELRAVWSGIAGHPAEEPAPAPLAERWRDWVETWIGLALAPGEELAVPVENASGHAAIRCTALDTRRTDLVYRYVRHAPPGPEVRCDHERGVEAELLTAGLRPLAVRSWNRWVWRRGDEVVRSPERESVFEFDWEHPPAEPEDAALASAEPPAAVTGWAAARWLRMTAGELEDEERWWRETWRALPLCRRAEVLAAVSGPDADLGSGRSARAWWLETRAALGCLWRGDDPLARPALPVRTWVRNGPSWHSVDVLLVGDGYTAEELHETGEYWADVDRVARGLLEEAPLAWYRDWFNVRAAFLESRESGCDASAEADEVDTALDARFESEDDENLWVDRHQELLEIVRTVGGADIVLVMVNTERNGGGGGLIPAGTRRAGGLATAVFSASAEAVQIALHELGHGLAGLADEYVDEELARELDRSGHELDFREPNVTRHGPDLAKLLKWNHFRELPGAEHATWLHEGANYQAKGAYRPWPRCLMRDHDAPLCPVCCEAMARAIYTACDLEFDDAAYHRAHPLDLWSR